MYDVSLVGAQAPDLLTLGTRSLRRGESFSVSYLTSDILDAKLRGWLTITPEPEVFQFLARVLNDQSNGNNLGLVVPPIQTLQDAADAISTLADSQNRITQDLQKLGLAVLNMQDNLQHVQSILDRYVKQ